MIEQLAKNNLFYHNRKAGDKMKIQKEKCEINIPNYP
ncbi:hypothetical protein SA3733_04665, partial [Aggregatibacter actinomycetemcomitans serotype d str. SA3733]